MYTLEGWLRKIEPLFRDENINVEKLRKLAEIFRKLNFSPKLSIAWALYFLTNKKKKEIENIIGCDLEFTYIDRKIKTL